MEETNASIIDLNEFNDGQATTDLLKAKIGTSMELTQKEADDLLRNIPDLMKYGTGERKFGSILWQCEQSPKGYKVRISRT